ncbi:TIGR02265 family protein, partial [Corallococcus sp. AB049A]
MDRGPVEGSLKVAAGRADECAAWQLTERCLAAAPEDGARGMFF